MRALFKEKHELRISIRAARRLLGMSEYRMKQMIDQGQIKTLEMREPRRVGQRQYKRLYVSPDELRRFLKDFDYEQSYHDELEAELQSIRK